MSSIKLPYSLEIDSFKGFDLDLYDYSDLNKAIKFENLDGLICTECLLNFYIGEKQIKSCQDYLVLGAIRSIFQLFTELQSEEFYEIKETALVLSESRNEICPLAFKNFFTLALYLYGQNSYFSRRVIEFSNEVFPDLNSTIYHLQIFIENVDIDVKMFNPSVFNQTRLISIKKDIKSIHSDFSYL